MATKKKYEQQIELLNEVQSYLMSLGCNNYNEQLTELREDVQKLLEKQNRIAERASKEIAKRRIKDPLYARGSARIEQYFNKLFRVIEKNIDRDLDKAKIAWNEFKQITNSADSRDCYKDLYKSYSCKLTEEQLSKLNN